MGGSESDHRLESNRLGVIIKYNEAVVVRPSRGCRNAYAESHLLHPLQPSYRAQSILIDLTDILLESPTCYILIHVLNYVKPRVEPFDILLENLTC
jgi:hypothetical protein